MDTMVTCRKEERENFSSVVGDRSTIESSSIFSSLVIEMSSTNWKFETDEYERAVHLRIEFIGLYAISCQSKQQSLVSLFSLNSS